MQQTPPLAHGPGHGLVDHLTSVGDRAAAHLPGPLAHWAQLAGLWHDLGKFRPGFQTYVRLDTEAHIEGRLPRSSDKTHSAAGALHALAMMGERFGPPGALAAKLLAQVIAGHHAGLYDSVDLSARLQGSDAPDSAREYREALQACTHHAPELLALPATLDPRRDLPAIPGLAERDAEPLALSLWLRLLFSALVDADFLDTEAYFDRQRPARRAGFAPLDDYLGRLDRHLDELATQVQSRGRTDDPVMRARTQVLAQCRQHADGPPGVYSLQVPTGGGKTLASLAFALRHAVRHGRRRVIVGIPYTSIVEQTADVFARLFGRDAVVEHHSQAETDPSRETARSRLACDNWDAPLVVTTNVQLLESLFAARPARCRKLHNLAGSVVVLDEAQLLPAPFLQPILDVLRLLVKHHGVTLLLCTATQPVLTDLRRFDPRQSLRGLPPPTEIVADPATLYAALERVRFEWPADWQAVTELPDLAASLAGEDCVLAVVNTRSDAAQLVAALDAASGDRALHLSAAMCGQHRADVIAEIRQRLADRLAGTDSRPLRVVSTQLVEAGVDLDFPTVFRALAGLDSIAQAAGRCNREGRLGPRGGRVVVFRRPIPPVLAALVRAAQATQSTLGEQRPDTLAPALFDTYFRHLYAQFDLDQHHIVDLLRANRTLDLQLATAAQKFRLVDDQDQVAIVVPYGEADGTADPARLAALAALRAGQADRRDLRLLQRWVVQARQREALVWLARGDIREAIPGWFVVADPLRYDKCLGLVPEGAVLDAATLVQ